MHGLDAIRWLACDAGEFWGLSGGGIVSIVMAGIELDP